LVNFEYVDAHLAKIHQTHVFDPAIKGWHIAYYLSDHGQQSWVWLFAYYCSSASVHFKTTPAIK
jgi:hypothetical protein|tara:strand:- start:1233 stop:1424 length:192 start_codon:yes stop_codon:yes gene_type:complete